MERSIQTAITLYFGIADQGDFIVSQGDFSEILRMGGAAEIYLGMWLPLWAHPRDKALRCLSSAFRTFMWRASTPFIMECGLDVTGAMFKHLHAWAEKEFVHDEPSSGQIDE
jgi:hypothetical protein